MNSLPYLAKTPTCESEWFEALMSLVRYLRSPEGCPWDQERTASEFAAFAGGEIEELSEALLADDNRHAEEEFGDSIFTLLACMAAAESEGRFSLASALARAHEKMVRRHAHVFREDRAATPEEAMASWIEIKSAEKAAREGRASDGGV